MTASIQMYLGDELVGSFVSSGATIFMVDLHKMVDTHLQTFGSYPPFIRIPKSVWVSADVEFALERGRGHTGWRLLSLIEISRTIEETFMIGFLEVRIV